MAIFLAVSWFSAVGKFLQPDPAIHVSILLLAYSSVCLLLWKVRHYPKVLHSICGIASHFVAFAAVRAGDSLQQFYFSKSPAGAVLSCVLFTTGNLGLWLLKHAVGNVVIKSERRLFDVRADLPGKKAKKAGRKVKSLQEAVHEWNEATDDVGWDAAGMCLAYTWIQALHFVVFGELGSLEEGDYSESRAKGLFFFAYGGVMGACMLRWGLGESGKEEEAPEELGKAWSAYNLRHLAVNVWQMSVAWGWLITLKFLILKVFLPGFSELFSDVVLALAISALTMLVVVVLSVWGAEHKTMQRPLRVIALVLAWSWEEAFDAAFKATALRGSLQLLLAGKLTALLAPIHCVYLKPLVHAL